MIVAAMKGLQGGKDPLGGRLFGVRAVGTAIDTGIAETGVF